MKKLFLGLMVLAALSLVFGGTALAAPVGPSEGFSVFGQYDVDWYDSFVVGAGYGISENLTIGGFYILNGQEFGVYANLALGGFRVNGEVEFDSIGYFGVVSALYAFDLDPVTIGVGGAFDFGESGFCYFYIDATAEVALDFLTVYGGFMYCPEDAYTTYKIGVSAAF